MASRPSHAGIEREVSGVAAAVTAAVDDCGSRQLLLLLLLLLLVVLVVAVAVCRSGSDSDEESGGRAGRAVVVVCCCCCEDGDVARQSDSYRLSRDCKPSSVDRSSIVVSMFCVCKVSCIQHTALTTVFSGFRLARTPGGMMTVIRHDDCN